MTYNIKQYLHSLSPETTHIEVFSKYIEYADILILAKALLNYPKLTTLDLQFINIGETRIVVLAEALKSCSNITKLVLRCTKIKANGVLVLAASILYYPHIVELDLSCNQIMAEGAMTLASTLPICTNLTTLDLSSNNIGPAGAVALAAVLPRCPNLAKLDLSANNILPEGVMALSAVLPSCTNLTKLDLSSNNIGLVGAMALADVLPRCPNLAELDLSWNSIEDIGALAEVLSNNYSLMDYGLTFIGGDKIKKVLERNKKLHKILQSHNTSVKKLLIKYGDNAPKIFNKILELKDHNRDIKCIFNILLEVEKGLDIFSGFREQPYGAEKISNMIIEIFSLKKVIKIINDLLHPSKTILYSEDHAKRYDFPDDIKNKLLEYIQTKDPYNLAEESNVLKDLLEGAVGYLDLNCVEKITAALPSNFAYDILPYNEQFEHETEKTKRDIIIENVKKSIAIQAEAEAAWRVHDLAAVQSIMEEGVANLVETPLIGFEEIATNFYCFIA